MKRLIVLCVVMLSAIGLAQTRVQVDGVPVAFDVEPQIRNGQLMVPVRNMLDNLGITMQWHQDREMIVLRGSRFKLDIQSGSRVAMLNDEEVTMEEAAYVYKGRTMVPLRVLAQATGSVISTEDGWVKLQTPKK